MICALITLFHFILVFCQGNNPSAIGYSKHSISGTLVASNRTSTIAPQVTQLVGTSRPVRNKYSEHSSISTSDVFHFPGHGPVNHWDSSGSTLLLDWQDNTLTVKDHHNLRVQNIAPFLGYLSARSTGLNIVDDLADESINLASACQLAGFRHVGTMWEVSDARCVDIVKVFYETVRDEGVTDEFVPLALHRAVRSIRDRETRIVGEMRSRWALGERDAELLDDEGNGPGL
ncbi:hypothetical protein M747DRAFT_119547 [Aspergillus niger ATCC 13496]|uniref:CHAT domain-containing protein n=1 Tax=Aspergillus niger ATCC 13496 TaxID=1353008 RepID=A0A370BLK6_ASPNG|nr:hypothetical protein M747DRAFT_119547 [Aspergillus niger ATCC 13496]